MIRTPPMCDILFSLRTSNNFKWSEISPSIILINSGLIFFIIFQILIKIFII